MSSNATTELEGKETLQQALQAEFAALMTRYPLKALVIQVGFEEQTEDGPVRSGFALEKVAPEYEDDIFKMLMDAIQSSHQRKKRNAQVAEANKPRIIH